MILSNTSKMASAPPADLPPWSPVVAYRRVASTSSGSSALPDRDIVMLRADPDRDREPMWSRTDPPVPPYEKPLNWSWSDSLRGALTLP